MAHFNHLRALLLAGTCFSLAACGATSNLNGYTSAPPEARQHVEKGGYSDEAMAQIAIVQNPDFNGGRISAKALRKIQQYSMSCQQQVDAQLAGAGQSFANSAIEYGAAGAAGGATQGIAYGPAFTGAGALIGGVSGALSGGVNGLITGSYALAYAKGDCTRQFWEDVVHTQSEFKGTHIVAVLAGKALGGSMPPALDPSVVAPPPGK